MVVINLDATINQRSMADNTTTHHEQTQIQTWSHFVCIYLVEKFKADHVMYYVELTTDNE